MVFPHFQTHPVEHIFESQTIRVLKLFRPHKESHSLASRGVCRHHDMPVRTASFSQILGGWWLLILGSPTAGWQVLLDLSISGGDPQMQWENDDQSWDFRVINILFSREKNLRLLRSWLTSLHPSNCPLLKPGNARTIGPRLHATKAAGKAGCFKLHTLKSAKLK